MCPSSSAAPVQAVPSGLASCRVTSDPVKLCNRRATSPLPRSCPTGCRGSSVARVPFHGTLPSASACRSQAVLIRAGLVVHCGKPQRWAAAASVNLPRTCSRTYADRPCTTGGEMRSHRAFHDRKGRLFVAFRAAGQTQAERPGDDVSRYLTSPCLVGTLPLPRVVPRERCTDQG